MISDNAKIYNLIANVIWQSKKENFHDCEIIVIDILKLLKKDGFKIVSENYIKDIIKNYEIH